MPKKKTHEEFEREVLELGMGEYQLLSNYVNTRTKLCMKHIHCGHKYEIAPQRFLLGQRCPNCSKGFTKKRTHQEFVSEVEKKGMGEYILLSQYQNSNSYVQMKHLTCGHIYDVRPKKFSEGRRCPNCYTTPKKTHEEFVTEVRVNGDGRYELLSTYKSTTDYVKLKHKDCGYEYNVRPYNFISGSRCPKCASSKGEHFIYIFLKKAGLLFEREFSFTECKNINPLRFDFCVKKPNGDILLLIEYDGKQHYKEIAHFGGRNGYLNRVKNDRIKSNFAKSKSIPLLRIRYDQKHPEKLLSKVIEYVQKEGSFKVDRAS